MSQGSNTTESADGSPAIAIVGISGRFPGAKSVDAFWENLKHGVESISRFTDTELEFSVASENLRREGARFVGARSVLEDVDLFDALFFGIYPREAELMDPQHRLFLESSWEVLEQAGYDPEQYPGMIGVFAGLSLNTYLLNNLVTGRDFAADFAGNYQVGAYQVMMGNDKDFMPVRVAYKLNLRGPAISVQCACSTSLVAVCQACTNLLSYQCDMALAGGASITFPQKRDYLYTEDAMVSMDGRVRTFDHQARGTVFGHGVGVVLLKRLEDAVADRDTILAVIRGFAVNNDGALKVGFAAPSVQGQANAITMAQAMAAVHPDTISYVEAHGTGTPLGDPIEVAALTKAFREGGSTRSGFCAIGTAKTNIGHLDVAAGVIGLIKTVLQLREGLIPPLLHFESPNPRIDFANSPVYPVTKLTEWRRTEHPRRAGVSAFGVGGTNAHVVVEEAPLLEPSGPSRQHQLLLVSARTPSALETAAQNLASHFDQRTDLNLADVAFTLQKGRRAFAHRRALVCRDVPEAVALLRAGDAQRVFTCHTGERRPAIAFLFPGQGAQYVDMGRELWGTEPVFRTEVDRCAAILQHHLDLDIRQVLYPDPAGHAEAERRINETWITQPGIFVTEYALAKLWLSWGIKPSVLIGHSIGEYVCAVLAATFTLDDALALLSVRARLMQALPAGSMLAVRLGAEAVEPLLPPGAAIAALNSPTLCTVSGPSEVMKQFQVELEARKIAARFLATSHAFHSPMMEPILPEFTAAAESTPRQAPTIRWISTCTGREITAEEIADASYWARQMRRTVRFADALEPVICDSQHVLLEVGPGQTLCQLARQHPAKAADLTVLATLGPSSEAGGELAAILASLGKLWLAGVNPDWDGFYATEKRRRVPLPTYPFERKRYWVEPVKLTPAAASPSPAASVPSLLSVTNPEATASETRCANSDSLPMSAATPNPTTATSRKDRLALELRNLVRDLSGIPESELAPAATFMELGFDSLFLTQASQAIQKKFAAKVTFRQMLEDLSSIDALASHLDQKLPPEAFPAETPKAAPLLPPAQTLVAPTSTAPTLLPPMLAASGLVERVIAQQMALMQQQLELLRTGPESTTATSAAPVMGAASLPVPSTTPTPPAPCSRAVAHGGEEDLKRFGPFKGIEIGPKGGLTPKQEKALAELTARYNRRTAGSKAYAQNHRSHFCDPRAAGNFRQQWKEMVYPIVCVRSKGGKIWDIDGNEYVDVTLGFGANYFGHSPDFVVKAVEEQLHKGFEIGPQSPLAGEVAQMLCAMTGMERATFCNTGSEAVMAAMRVARTVTARDKIVYFTGDYHGIFDEVLAHAGIVDGLNGALPIAPGIPPLPNMIVLEYGSPASLHVIRARANEIAAVMVEPVQSRHLHLQPRDFLQALRQVTREKDIALIFDEVVTGFRAALGGAQEYFGVRADLATYGKVVGGGMPIGVLAGTRQFMDALDGGMWKFGDASYPEVGVTFFAGTFVRHPLAMAAAHATLKYLQQAGPDLQRQTTKKTALFARRLNDYFASIQVPIRLQTFSSVFYYDFHPDLKYASLLFYYLRDRGVHIWEGRVGQVCTPHTEEELNLVFDAFKASVEEMQSGGFLPARDGADSISEPAKEAILPSGQVRAPLTEAQREIWIAAQMGEDANCAYNESCSVHLRGNLDVDKFQQALQRFINRHDALRCRFSPTGDYQEFVPEVTVELPVRDLVGLTPEQRAYQTNAIISGDMAMPFDLVNGPVFRVQLLKHANDEHQFIFTTHHAVCDGWSFGVVFHELAQLYSTLVEGKPCIMEPAMQFREYTECCQQQQGSPEVRESEQFWIQKFAGTNVPALELPTDRPRPALKTYNGSLAVRRCDPQVFRDLKAASGKMGNTLFGTLFSAFYVLLHRLTGQEDIVMGIAAAGQTMVGSSDLLGHCLNFLPIRSSIDAGQPFAEFAGRIKKDVLDAYDHQNYTYGTLIQKLKLPRDASRLPLLSVMFNIDKRGMDKLNFAGLKATVSTNPKEYVNFDLFVNLVQGDNDLDLECEFNTDLFDHETVMRWLGHFETVMSALASHPRLALGDVPLNNSSERQCLLVEWNRTQRDYPRNLTVNALFEEQAQKNPTKVAVRCEERSLTYSELDLAAGELAVQLQAFGVKSGDLVGLALDRSVEMVVGVLGILKSGAAYVPMDPTFPTARLACMIEDAQMPVIVTHSKLVSELPPHAGRILTLDTLPHSPDIRSGVTSAQAEDLAYVMFTSGSTGRPKGVRIPHCAVVNFLNSMRREPGLGPDDVLLSVTTLSFDIAGLELFLPLTTGATVIIASRETLRDGNLLKREIERGEPTVMQATPSTWRLLLEAGWTGSSNLKILVGGEAVPKELVNQLLPRCRSLWNLYGPTETTIWSTAARLTASEGPVSIGRPIDNTQVFIAGPSLQLQPVGVPGELLIGGHGLARGYHQRPELTAEKFIPNPFSAEENTRVYRTGDLAKWQPDGTIECLGRIDQQVKIRGFRIELGEVETVLGKHPGVKENVVVAREDVPDQKRLVAYFVPATSPGPTASQLRNHLSGQLPDYMVPALFEALEKLPLTPNGKVDRKALPVPLAETTLPSRDFVAPRNDKEKALADIWLQVLGLEKVSVLDNFFELGGDSLQSFRVANRANQLGLPLTPRLFFQHGTIAELVKAIEREEVAQTKPATPAIARIDRSTARRRR